MENKLETIEKLLTDAKLDGIVNVLQELVSGVGALRNAGSY